MNSESKSPKASEETATSSSSVTKSVAAPFAVVRTGGKQFVVRTGDRIRVEKLPGAQGESVTIGDVLLRSNGDTTEVGAPLIKGAAVSATIVGQRRAKKVVSFRKQRRTGYTKTIGHRQEFTELKIESLGI